MTELGITAAERNIVWTYNPFRYRGYYYDTETGFYYLQSRYYNPQWGRFLNADGYVSTGQGLLGYNMYAYCNNNPVMLVDSMGNRAERIDTVTSGTHESSFSKAIRKFIVDITYDIRAFDISNENEATVVYTHYFSMYKQHLVLKSSLLDKSAASFGIIIMGSNITSTNVVKHEWGHTEQLEEMGVIKYSLVVATPSFTHACMDELGIYDIKHYHSLPWEYDADIRGGVIGLAYTSDVTTRHKNYFGFIDWVEEGLRTGK